VTVTGGGVGTNQYEIRGLSHAQRQNGAVLADLAEMDEGLDGWLDEGTPDAPSIEDDEARERFRIENLDQASWAMRKLGKVLQKRAEIREVAERRKEQVDEWCAAEIRRTERDREFFGNLLVDYHERALADDPRRKTINLPEGALKARKTPDKVDVFDPDTFVTWAEEADHTDLLRVSVSPDKTALKGWLAEHPDAPVPGARIEPGQVVFNAEPTFD